MQSYNSKPVQGQEDYPNPPIDWTKILPLKLKDTVVPDPLTQAVCFPKANATQQQVHKWAKKFGDGVSRKERGGF